jgi:hypothetical protein
MVSPVLAPDGSSFVGALPPLIPLSRIPLDSPAANSCQLAVRHVQEFKLPIDARSVRFSPDGRRILFIEQGTVAIANADGNGKRLIGSGSMTSAAWSADGSRIVFGRTVRREGNCTI